jgi:hypothetical protein
MNEPLFKNHFIRDKSTALEIVKSMLLLTSLMKIVYVLWVISLLSTVVIAIFQNKLVYLIQLPNIATYVMLPLLLLLMFFALKSRNTPKGGQCEESFVITNDEIAWTSAGEKRAFDIKDIAMYYNSKNYIIVIIKGRNHMIPAIKKDSFKLGDAQGFIDFLKSKGIKEQK